MLNAIKTALQSIWSNKARSFLNVLGVIIGVSSVTILVSLGEGLKTDVSKTIQGFGTNVIVITSGKLDTKNPNSANSNPANFISGDILTLKDVDAIAALPEVSSVAPGGLVAGTMKYGDKSATPTIFGSYPSIMQALEILKIDKGQMFTRNDQGNVIIIGSVTKTQLFGDEDPIGKKVTVGKQELTVIGTFAESTASSTFGGEIDSIAIMPFDTAALFNNGQKKVFRMYATAKNSADVAAVKSAIEKTLKDNHNGEEDFTVLTQDDMLGLFNTFLNLATTMVSAIAAISLVVGGIGIMNIMLVTVTERTREIGLRKAVGATKSAILVQFLIEAVIVTFVGAMLGLLLAFGVDLIVAAKTELSPAITPSIVLLAVGISVVVGVIFGLWPAIRAAQKDPIEALRYE